MAYVGLGSIIQLDGAQHTHGHGMPMPMWIVRLVVGVFAMSGAQAGSSIQKL
jgi:hypothetical protein